MIAVTFSLPSESADFLARLENRTHAAEAILGSIATHEVCVVHIGVGERETRRRLAAFLRDHAPARLISAGFAGALNDSFTPAQLLIATNFSSREWMQSATPALASLRPRLARLATIGAVVDSATARAQLAEKSAADAVDMETEFVAELCSRAGIPMLSLRAISDTPDAPFPAPPEILFDVPTQRTPVGRLLLHLARHPIAIVRLIRFARQVAETRRSLAEALTLLIRNEPRGAT